MAAFAEHCGRRQPSDGQVVIATIAEGRLGPVAAISWDLDVANDAAHARWMAGQVSQAFATADVDDFIPVTYGPHAHQRAVLLCGAFAEYGNAHIGIAVDREVNTARVIDPPSSAPLMPPTSWSHPPTTSSRAGQGPVSNDFAMRLHRHTCSL